MTCCATACTCWWSWREWSGDGPRLGLRNAAVNPAWRWRPLTFCPNAPVPGTITHSCLGERETERRFLRPRTAASHYADSLDANTRIRTASPPEFLQSCLLPIDAPSVLPYIPSRGATTDILPRRSQRCNPQTPPTTRSPDRRRHGRYEEL
jgi:hypothetical protein